MTKHENNNKKTKTTQSSSKLPWTTVRIGLIAVCILIGPGILFAAALLFESFRVNDVFAEPVLLTNVAIIIGFGVSAYLIHRHSKRRKFLIPALIVLTVLAGVSVVLSTKTFVPAYREFRVTEAKDKIDEYLEEKYYQEFNIYNVKYHIASHLGDDSGVIATANLVSEPDVEFIVEEEPHANDGNYTDYFMESYNKKYSPANTAKFSDALRQQMGDSYIGTTNITHDPSSIVLHKSASVNVKEKFNRKNYDAYKQSLRTIGSIVDSIGLNDYSASLHTDKSNDKIFYGNFSCSVSPNERVSEESFNKAFNTCVEWQEQRLEGLHPPVNQ